MTYSLTLREGLGRKLTIRELDDNFRYVLENASGGSGATGPQGPQGPGNSGGGTFSLELFGYTSSVYTIDYYNFMIVNSSTGTYSVGDIILASQSGSEGEIVNILATNDPEAYLWIETISGTFNYQGDNEIFINQTQVGELTGLALDPPIVGNALLFNIEGEIGPYGEAQIISIGTSSLVLSTTYSISQYDLILQEGDLLLIVAIKDFVEETITTTFSIGLQAGTNVEIPGGMITGILNYVTDGSSVGFSGVAQIELESVDNTAAVMIRSDLNTISAKIISNIGLFESHNEIVNGCFSNVFHSFMDGIQLEHSDGSCCSKLKVSSTEVSYTRSALKFNLPDNCPGYYGSFLRGCVSCDNISMYWDNDQCNTFLGWRAGDCNTGTSNTFIGPFSGVSNTGADNTFIGFESGYSNLSGCRNTFIGNNTGYSTNTGYGNVFIGDLRGCSNVTGANNTLIGSNTNVSSSTNNSIVIGANAVATVNGEFVLGSSAFPILTGTTASVNGGSLDTLGVAYLCVTLNGNQYKLPLYQ